MPDRFQADKQDRIAAARALIAEEPDGSAAAEFAALLFEGAAAEDLVEYSAGDLAEIAREAFRFFSRRKPPAEIRVFEVASPDWKGRSSTAVEVLTSNRPFIVDSVLGELQANGHAVKLALHPILEVARAPNGDLLRFGRAGPEPTGAARESLVHVHIPHIASADGRERLAAQLTTLLAEVHAVTDDFGPMLARFSAAIVDAETVAEERRSPEAVAFLEWLANGNFVFLGMREFAYASLVEEPMEGEGHSGLGLLRDPAVKVLRRGDEFVTITPQIREFLTSPDPLIVTKADVRARVHRRDDMDYIGVKLFDGDGAVAGELRIIGLFTLSAFTQSVQAIPLIQTKVQRVLERAGFDPVSHDGKALVEILETYPRTELFQADADSLYESALAILHLETRPRVRVLSRRDRFDRFVSVLVYVPRDRYSSDLRVRIGELLADRYCGQISSFTPDLSGSTLARVHFIVRRDRGRGGEPSQDEIESGIRALLRNFADDLQQALADGDGVETAATLFDRYRGAFAPDYQAAFPASVAARDIRVLETLGPENPLAARFEQRSEDGEDRLVVRLHHLGAPIPLSRRVPLLENLGFLVIDERTYRIEPGAGPPAFVNDMVVAVRGETAFDPAEAGDRLSEAVLAIWRGAVENDGFNALVLSAGLTWREAAVLRTVGRYLRQTAIPFSIDYIWGTLQRFPAIARLLLQRFLVRFAPEVADRASAEARTDEELQVLLHSVASLDDDTILRGCLQVIRAVQRTDFFSVGADGQPSAAITLKLRPGDLAFVPAPRPYREIFVLAPDVEGLHMRFGPVARGGLRWSDRPQDYRLEVLGLVKAQQVKNAVIVPVGAKGGFVPLKPTAGESRDAVFEAGRQAYITFVDRLLAVTDNLDGDAVVPPPGVVRHDGDDPYLVVAADKGTASFSDTANAVATERGFWLGDAFASGGSAGYDHKEMGITARGAWEAVKRHFREMNRDIQTEPFSVAGVGDMSGDVFGNGMLLSPAIRLVAAFDHRDIFIDPDPDPVRSLAERQRLFALPRSSWQDYDRALISAGGGVYSRRDKQIALSAEAKSLLGLQGEAARPTEIITAILRAPVDLLWFGGIGTYVRAPVESDLDVGDKANDAVRVVATELRAKVVGEGANLAVTPKARVAYSLNGGRCNSDAIDNSGGVNSSDLEVNIKIALAPAVRSGKLGTEDRNFLLKDMTEEVAALVLRNNTLQTLAVSLEALRGMEGFPSQVRLIRELEGTGLLDRTVESLPDEAALAERQASDQALTRPEIGTLLAFAKIALFDDLVASDVPDDPYFLGELIRYFPAGMQERFRPEIEAHRLRREIVATRLSNSLVNRGGPTLVSTLNDDAAISSADVTRAYWAVRDSFAMDEYNAAIEALDTRIGGDLQLDLYRMVQEATVDRIGWFLRSTPIRSGLADVVAHYRPSIASLAAALPEVLAGTAAAHVEATRAGMTAGGVPPDTADRLALLPVLASSTDVIVIADQTGRDLKDAARAFFAVADRFHFGSLNAMLDAVPGDDYYEALAVQRARDALGAAHRDLGRALLVANPRDADLSEWERSLGLQPAAAADQVATIIADGAATSAKGTVAAAILAEFARAAGASAGSAAFP